MEHADLILSLDKQQSIWNENAVKCPANADHGRMLPMRDAVHLVCGKCGAVAPAIVAA